MLPPPTPKQAQAAAADAIVIQPFSPPSAHDRGGVRQENPRAKARYSIGERPPHENERDMLYPGALALPEGTKQSKQQAWKIDLSALRLYAGFEGLLVRTALIRQPGYERTSLPRLRCGSDVLDLLRHLASADLEHFVVLSMNQQNDVMAIYEGAVGSSNSAQVNIRDVLKTVILSGGLQAIIAQNHPSGDPTPSAEDELITARLKQAFHCVGYKLLDHVIVARDGHYSFFNSGKL